MTLSLLSICNLIGLKICFFATLRRQDELQRGLKCVRFGDRFPREMFLRKVTIVSGLSVDRAQ